MFLYPVFLINLCVLNKIFFSLTHKSHKDFQKLMCSYVSLSSFFINLCVKE